MQDKQAINDNVTTLIIHMYRIFAKKKTLDINPWHRHFGFVMTFMFQQVVQLWGKQFFFPIDKCTNPTMNLMNLTLLIENRL
jgi:hypothetical protein